MSEARCTVPAIITTLALLNFEEAWLRWSGRKDEAIRARFSITGALVPAAALRDRNV